MKTIKVVFAIGFGLAVLLMFVGKPSQNIFASFVKVVRNIIIGLFTATALLADAVINPNAT